MPPNVMVAVFRGILRRHRETHFIATVDTFTGGGPTATVIRNGQTVADGEEYVVADHVGILAPGDIVFLVDSTGGGGFLILAKIA